MDTNRNKFIKGIKDGLPISLGYLSVSFTFGLIAREGGLSVLSAVLISFMNLTSAGQFAGLSIIVMGGGILELALTTLVINIRYLLMSFSLTQKIDPNMGTLKRLILSFGITDEIFAVASGQNGFISAEYFLGLIILPIIGWSLGTFVGAGASALLPISVRNALPIAIYGMFIAIIVPPAKKSRNIAIVTLMSVLISCLFKFIPLLNMVSSGFVIITATVISASLGAYFLKGGQAK